MTRLSALFLTAIFAVVLQLAQPYIEDAFADQFHSNVAEPYLRAVDNYLDSLDHLATQLASYDHDGTRARPIIKELVSATSSFVGHLEQAAASSHSLFEWTENGLYQQTAKINEATAAIKQKELELTRATGRHKVLSSEVGKAETKVAAAERMFDYNTEKVRQAERAYYRARHKCVGRKRVRRGINVGKAIGDWFKKAGDDIKREFLKIPQLANTAGKLIYRGFCEFLNLFTKRINRARAALAKAKKELQKLLDEYNNASLHLAFHNKTLQELQESKITLLHQLTLHKQRLHELTALRNRVIALEAAMKKCAKFLKSLEKRGQRARTITELGFLLDPDKLVVPLKEIGEKILGLKKLSSSERILPSLSTEKYAALVAKLRRLNPDVPE